MNVKTGNGVLETLRTVSRIPKSVFPRHTHTTYSLHLRPHGLSLSTSQPFSSSRQSLAPESAEAASSRKTRSYTSQATASIRSSDSPFNAPQEVRWTGLRQRTGTQPVEKYLSGRRRDGQEDSNGGIIVTSHRHTLRDKQGRPWTRTSAEGATRGAGAPVVSIGVAVSAPPAARKRKPRIQLRDLAVKPKKRLEPWQAQKAALDKKFGDEGWNPRKKISPDAMDGIRALHEEDPERWSTPVLAEHFKVSAEAIRRILKSKWKPKNDDEAQKRRERWARRYDRIWDHQAELGLRPQREKDREVEDPDTFDEDLRAKEMLDNARRA